MPDKRNLQPHEDPPPNVPESNTIYFCLYVSQSNFTPPANRVELDKILSSSHLRNKELDVTGALLCTAGRFAQIIEGPEISVRILMKSIELDSRHRYCKVLSEGLTSARRFSEWTMAYLGPSIHIDRHIKPLLQNLFNQDQTDKSISRLIDLMVRQTNMRRPEGAEEDVGP